MAVTPTIYWAYNSANTTLTLSSSEVSGTASGSFDGDTVFSSYSDIPWYSFSNNITTANISNTICPVGTAYWFHNCELLSVISNIRNLDTSNVTRMVNMFYGCSSLAELDLSTFDTSNVTRMTYMFCGCSSLTELDISTFDASNVTHIKDMFNGCSSLVEIDATAFDVSNITTMINMFYGCSSLTTIYANTEWETSWGYSNNMFADCTSLVGGNGTTYDPNYIDETYAHVDTADNPGYFTYKSPPQSNKTYIGVGNQAKAITNMYVGVNGVAKKITKAYIGVNGQAKKIF